MARVSPDSNTRREKLSCADHTWPLVTSLRDALLISSSRVLSAWVHLDPQLSFTRALMHHIRAKCAARPERAELQCVCFRIYREARHDLCFTVAAMLQPIACRCALHFSLLHSFQGPWLCSLQRDAVQSATRPSPPKGLASSSVSPSGTPQASPPAPHLIGSQPALDPPSTRTQPALSPHSARTHPALTPHSSRTQPVLSPYSTRTQPVSNLRPTCAQPAPNPHPTRTQPALKQRSTRTQPALNPPAPNPLSTRTRPGPSPHTARTQPVPNLRSTRTQPAPDLHQTLSNPLSTRTLPALKPHPACTQPALNPHPARTQAALNPRPARTQPALNPDLTHIQPAHSLHPTSVEQPPCHSQPSSPPTLPFTAFEHLPAIHNP